MGTSLTTQAVVLDAPGKIGLRRVNLDAPTSTDITVRVDHSGISTGTEKLLWLGTMPQFPGLGYPLVPGYEAVGTVIDAGSSCTMKPGTRVFIPGASCYGDDVRGLFGASASTLVVPEKRTFSIGDLPSEHAVLLALSATAMHILTHQLRRTNKNELRLTDLASQAPDLIIGHGTLGRLLALICEAIGAQSPVIWESNAERRDSMGNYSVLAQSDDDRHDYQRICDVSGAGGALFDQLITRLTRGGQLVLGGFYADRVSFNFPVAFMREVQLSVSAEWVPDDMRLVQALIDSNSLSLDGLVTHRERAENSVEAYSQAFNNQECLKMVLDWSNL